MTSALELEALYQTPATLKGEHVTLVPLGPEHAESLLTALNADEELWRYLPTKRPETIDEMRDWVAGALQEQVEGRRLPFVVVEKSGGQIIGSTSYITPSYANRSLDIGWTWYNRDFWRTAVNTECKLMLFTYAFETLQCIRVQFRVDLRNMRSQRAVERIGGVKDGVLRKVQILFDGHHRDVVILSVLDTEWPANKARLEGMMQRGRT